MCRRIVRSPVVIVAIGFLVACGRGSTRSARDRTREDVVARVNGAPIARADVQSAQGSAGHPGAVRESEKNVLEGLIVRELEAQKADELGLDPGEDYWSQLARLEAQVAAFKRLRLSEAFERREFGGAVKLSEDEVRKYFDEHSGELRTEHHVYQILLRDEAAIEKAHRDLAAGKQFEDVARGLIPNAPKEAGQFWDVGYLHWNQLPPQWRGALERMKPGETSEVIKGPKNRFWIVKLVDRREDRALTFESVKRILEEQLKAEKAAELRSRRVADLRKRARIEYTKAGAEER